MTLRAFDNINYITLYAKEERKLLFPNLLVYLGVYLEPSQAFVMELFMRNS